MEINAFIRKSQPKGTKQGNEKYTTNKFQYIVRQEQQCNKCKKHMQHMQQVPYLRNVLLQKALNRSLTIANATKSLRNADNTTETMPVQSYYCTYICCKHVPVYTWQRTCKVILATCCHFFRLFFFLFFLMM